MSRRPRTAWSCTSPTPRAAEQQVAGDLILVATGRRANVEGNGLEAAGVQFEPARIPTDEYRRTNVPHIYAVGDVAGYWQLAHTAFREGELAAENIAGHNIPVSGAVPRCIYTDPEIAGVGLTEEEAIAEYGKDAHPRRQDSRSRRSPARRCSPTGPAS